MLMVPCPASEFSIVTGDALAFFIYPKNDELAGLLFAGNARSFNDEAFDTGRKKFRVNDFEHRRAPQQTATIC